MYLGRLLGALGVVLVRICVRYGTPYNLEVISAIVRMRSFGARGLHLSLVNFGGPGVRAKTLRPRAMEPWAPAPGAVPSSL